MTPTELKIARERIEDARRSGNPPVQDLAAVCEWLVEEIEAINEKLQREGGK